MSLRAVLVACAIAVVIEVIAVKYWIDNAGFDCYPSCDTGQTVSGWAALIVPLLVVCLLAFSLARWVRSRG